MADTPMNPKAGVSGPGKYAVRTDNLQMGSTAYGEGIETAKIKSSAPLASTPDQRPMPAAEVREAAMSPVTGLYDPSSRPGEAITSGIDMGCRRRSIIFDDGQVHRKNFRYFGKDASI